MRTSVAAGLIAVAGLTAGAFFYGKHVENLARVAEVEGLKNNYAEATAKAISDQREEEARRTGELEKVKKDAQIEIDKYAADAGSARAALGSLQQRVASLVASSRSGADSAAAERGKGKSSADTIDLLAGMLKRHTEELARVGEFADQLKAAGLACERSYDALQKH